MAVSKRTRYEVLKRDNHTCRYCGASAPDATLTVDHVVPTALGGSDAPDNLVAACRDCNAGKSSTSPDAAVVEDVKQLDLKWSQAIKRVAAARARQRKKRADYVSVFTTAWAEWTVAGDHFPMPLNALESIERFYEVGVPAEEMRRCVRIACGNDRIAITETFRYFAGCMWRIVTEMQEDAKALLAAQEAEGAE